MPTRCVIAVHKLKFASAAIVAAIVFPDEPVGEVKLSWQLPRDSANTPTNRILRDIFCVFIVIVD